MAEILAIDDGPRRAMLLAYLDEIKAKPWAWGSMDCAHAAARWVNRLSGIDAARAIPAYASAEEANAIAKAAGGLDRLVWTLMADCGFALSAQPIDGDIAVILGKPNVFAIGGGAVAIYCGGLWISKAHFGLYGCRDRALFAWSIPGP